MADLVVDASVVVCALAETTDEAKALRDRLAKTSCHAPHVVDAEVGHALRRLERLGQVEPDAALTALRMLRHVVTSRYPQGGALAELAWSMRENVSYYDALYVSLAAILRIPLLTMDTRLAGAPGLACEVELVAVG